MNSLPKTVTRHRRGCDLNPGPSAPESSTLSTRSSLYIANSWIGTSAAIAVRNTAGNHWRDASCIFPYIPVANCELNRRRSTASDSRPLVYHSDRQALSVTVRLHRSINQSISLLLYGSSDYTNKPRHSQTSRPPSATCGAGSMKRSGVRLYPSVCPSVCPNRSTATTPDGGFADERPAANDFGRQLRTPCAGAEQQTPRAASR